MASGVPAKSTCTEWSTTKSTGTRGSMILGFLPNLHDGGAHGGQIDQERNAGKILQDDAGDDERNFLGARGLGLPLGQFADVMFRRLFFRRNCAGRIPGPGGWRRAIWKWGRRRLFEGGQRIIGAGFAVAEVKFLQRVKKIM